MRKGLLKGLLSLSFALCFPAVDVIADEAGAQRSQSSESTNDPSVVQLFRQFTFKDKKTGISLPYNLYVPKNMEKGKKYPFVLFMHDLSGVGKEVTYTLTQGDGATVWASPEWQAKHPCFVLAPEFEHQTVNDHFTVSPDVDACLDLIDSLLATYPVDRNRVYTTGQSMGCMTSYVMMLHRPDLFASAMLVAGQWDPTQLAPLSKKNLWLLSCKGDKRSSDGVAAALKVWNANGGIAREQEWPLDTTEEARAQEVTRMLMKGGNIHYTHFRGGDHRTTWQVAYKIEGIREWLFAQRRPYQASTLYEALANPKDTTLMIAAWHGDWHGNKECSIMSMEKAMMKGAHIAAVDVSLNKNNVYLESGELLEAALDSLKGQLLIAVRPSDTKTAKAVESLLRKRKALQQVILYGGSYGTSMGYIAPVTLTSDAAQNQKAIATILKGKPLAVELDYTDTTDVSRSIRQVKAYCKVCFNIAGTGLNADYDASRALDREQTPGIDQLIRRGADILITSELKHVMMHLQGLDAGANAPQIVSSPTEANWYQPVDSIDFSPRHASLIYGPDSTYRPMDEPWFQSELIAPGTWRILSDGDYIYLVEGDSTALCIDTGYGAGNLRRYCQSLTSKPVRYVVNTHYHFDHTAGNAYFDCTFMHRDGVAMATKPYASFKGIWFPRNYPVVTVDDGYTFHLGGRDLEVISIPNHTPGGIALLDRSHRILFVGDEILSDHMAKLNVSVAQYAANMQKLVNVIDDYDLIVGGMARITDVSCVKRLLACAQHILDGGANEANTTGKKGTWTKTEPAIPAGAEAVYVRHSPRQGDSAGAEAPASEYTQMTYGGVTLTYLKDKIR